MKRLLVDFNEIKDGKVRSLDDDPTLELNQWVVAHDGGEEEAIAQIVGGHDGLVVLALNWSTFGPRGHIHVDDWNGVWWTEPVAA